MGRLTGTTEKLRRQTRSNRYRLPARRGVDAQYGVDVVQPLIVLRRCGRLDSPELMIKLTDFIYTTSMATTVKFSR